MYAGMHPAHPAHPDPDFETLDLPRIGMADGSDISPIIRRPRPRVSPLGSAVILRAVLAFLTFAVLGALAIPAMAQAEGLRLRGDVTARGDILTLADLVEGVPERLAARPLFRAPTLGATGTIQTRRILDAAAALGLANLETGGRLQIAVQRAARRLGPPEIEAALKRGLETSYGLDPRSVTIRFDGDGRPCSLRWTSKGRPRPSTSPTTCAPAASRGWSASASGRPPCGYPAWSSNCAKWRCSPGRSTAANR